MKVVALISGGKDSCYNMMQCVSEGHEIIALANLKPKDKDELDSYMYQTVGHHAIDLYAEAMSLPLYRRVIEGGSVEQGRDYMTTPQDEVEDLYALLKQVKDELGIEGVSVGAILSDYQRVRVENVCSRLGLTSLAYLWRRDQEELMREMIACQVDAVIIKVAALGLLPKKHLGVSIADIFPHMKSMEEKYGLNICGEGGEFETFTLDCPLFNKKIVIDEQDIVIHSDDAFAPVGYINFRKMHLEDKDINPSVKLIDRVKNLPMKRGSDITRELFSIEEFDQLNQHGGTTEESSKPREDESSYQAKQNSLTDYPRISTSRTSNKNSHLCISGVVGLMTEDTSVECVTKNTMERLQDVLFANNLSMSHIILVHVYVKNMKNFAEINGVYKRYFSINPPARVCVQTDLPENVLLQLDCIAIQAGSDNLFSHRPTMHVQGLSHWAPANIGPYSQAVKVDKTVFVAGNIPLCPSSMSVIEGGFIVQCRLALRHVQRILAAMHTGVTLRNATVAVCYVTHSSFIKHAKDEWARTQSVDELGDATECVAMVTYVVAPALPRGVLVEWEVRATTSPIGQCAVEPLKKDTVDYNIHGYLLTSPVNSDDIFASESSDQEINKSSQLGLQLNVDVNGSHKEVDGAMLTSILQQCLLLYHQSASDQDVTLTCLRLFYRQDLIQYMQLQKAFDEARSTVKKGELSCALIPVLHLEVPTQVLSVCL